MVGDGLGPKRKGELKMKVEIFFGSRTAENSNKHIKSLYGELTTEHAASSYGIPVVVFSGRAYGCAELNNLAPDGYYCGLRPAGESSLLEAGKIIEKAGYRPVDTFIGWLP